MGNQPLFRTAALAAQKQQWLGKIILVRPISYLLLTSMAVACAVMVIAFMYFGSYTKRSTVTGQLFPESGLIKINTPQTGVVIEQQVKEGQQVNKGDILFILSSERYSDDNHSIQASISAQHQEQRASLQNEIIKTHQQQLNDVQALKARMAGLKDELSRLDAQYTSQQMRVRLSDETYRRYEGLLAQNYISKEQTQQKQEDWLEQNSRLETIARERVRTQREITARQDDIASLHAKHQNQIAQIERAISNVNQQFTESEAKRRIVIRAPETGTATAVVATLGSTAEGSRPLVSIMPKGDLLQAYLFAPSRAVGFLQTGAPVRLRYQAYPYQKFGQAKGHVLSVSRTALASGEIFTMGTLAAAQNNEPLYRITVALDKQTILAYGHPQPLQAGMLLDADIMLENRRLYEWVLEPLLSLTGKF